MYKDILFKITLTTIMLFSYCIKSSSGDNFTPFNKALECFPQLDEPTCTFSISKNATSDLKTECIENNGKTLALRIQGEFDKLKIKCSASYPIDFLFYGIQPTEAMLIDWWKEIKPHTNLSIQNYTVEVTVYSVQALFDFYNNSANSYFENPTAGLPLKTMHDYSRSGNFTFPGIFNKAIGPSFFLFLEDKARPSFLRNNNTKAIKVVDDKFVIPCVSSHYSSKVDLKISNSNVQDVPNTWNPAVGFSIDLTEQLEGTFTCILKDGENYMDEVSFTTYKPNVSYSKNDHFGLENFVASEDIDIGCETEGHPYVKLLYPFCKTKDPLVQVDENKLQLISVPVHNFGYMRLVQLFALPKYVNRSYTAKVVDATEGNWDTLVRTIRSPNGTILRMGTIYCSTGHAERIIDFGSPIGGKAIPFNFGLDWATFDRLNSRISVHFGLDVPNHTGPFYAFTEVTFECRINIPVLVKPVVWYSEWKNGSIIQEFIDYELDEDKSTYQVKLSMGLKRIFCASSYWYSYFWRNISKPIDVQEPIKPEIMGIESEYKFQPGSELNNIRCSAKGQPQPEIYFERNGQKMTERAFQTTEGVILFFPKIDQSHTGTYACVAKNVYETKKHFNVILQEDSGSHDITLIIVIPLVVFMLTILGAYVYVKFFRTEKTGLTQQEIEDFIKGLQKKGEHGPTDGNDYAHEFAAMTPYSKEYEIPSERFKIDESKVLGSGAFGLVLQGSVDKSCVAVKTVQRNADKQYIKALLSELKIMIYLGQHEHLVPIIGAYTKDLRKGNVFVFVKYLPNGNLQSFLRNNKDSFQLPQSSSNNSEIPKTETIIDTNHFKMNDLTRWSKQIASGMQYLVSKKVIHGDLAARNILLDEDKNVKITDFGLSRQLYDYNDYVKKQQEPLPWRWMALESLKYMSFSKHSDVWAFGVTLWEIFSLGEVPYPGYSWNLSFVEELELGLRMGRPKYGSQQLFAIMYTCWHQDIIRRPSFEDLIKQLENLPESM